MGKSLYENADAARAVYDRANAVLPFDLKDICFNGPEAELTQTGVCQPALYVQGIAIYETLKAAGKLPEVQTALGLSLGELTAHAVAETYDFETGLRIVAERGRLMQEACEASAGGMASLIGGDVAKAEELAQEFDVDVGNLNCPGQTVLSGDKERVLAATQVAKERGFKMAVPLKVAGAYHSRLMQPAAEKFEAFLKEIPFAEPKLTVFTNVTGASVKDPQAIKDALVRQVVSSVRWTDCFSAAVALGVESFYECGPGAVLAGLAKRIDRGATVRSLNEYSELPL